MSKKGAEVAEEDGGYHAIKGFLYQYDKTIIELCRDETATVGVECFQDISTTSYYLQVKNIESSTYTPSRIKKALKTLLKFHQQFPTGEIRLFCHFKDQPVSSRKLSVGEVVSILSTDASTYQPHIDDFCKRFTLEFSEDFLQQFERTLRSIASSFSLPDNDLAVIHHGMIRSLLLDLIMQAEQKERVTSLTLLKAKLNQQKKTLVYDGYQEHLAVDKYERLLKQMFFTHSRTNIEHEERLFVIKGVEMEEKDVADTVAFLKSISKKFFREKKSPAPLVSLINATEDFLRSVKAACLTDGLNFTDGARYIGHSPTFSEVLLDNQIKAELRMLEPRMLEELRGWSPLRRVYLFHKGSQPPSIGPSVPHYYISVQDLNQAQRILS